MNNYFFELKTQSLDKIKLLKDNMQSTFSFDSSFNKKICVFTCGSLGRLEMSNNSDLDLFFIIDSNEPKPVSNLDKYNFFSKMYDINKKNQFPEPSKQGEYWEFIKKENLLDIGSRNEDFNNSFTARMLLMLESRPLYNEELYNKIVDNIVEKYFVDYEKHSDNFYPLFLINDILRYWYTLALNYEYRRDPLDDENKKNWKRLKLKFARLITCYSMIACLFKPQLTPEDVKKYMLLTPFERINELETFVPDINSIISRIKTEYKWYMDLRKYDINWWTIKNKNEAFKKADEFHQLVIHELMKKVSETNSVLKEKLDLY
ncbi:MAG: hypothetical protein IJE10_05960 [Clostridia bacterium]|nr:hypothetical protein [Clostridia bacterium]